MQYERNSFIVLVWRRVKSTIRNTHNRYNNITESLSIKSLASSSCVLHRQKSYCLSWALCSRMSQSYQNLLCGTLNFIELNSYHWHNLRKSGEFLVVWWKKILCESIAKQSLSFHSLDLIILNWNHNSNGNWHACLLHVRKFTCEIRDYDNKPFSENFRVT